MPTLVPGLQMHLTFFLATQLCLGLRLLNRGRTKCGLLYYSHPTHGIILHLYSWLLMADACWHLLFIYSSRVICLIPLMHAVLVVNCDGAAWRSYYMWISV